MASSTSVIRAVAPSLPQFIFKNVHPVAAANDIVDCIICYEEIVILASGASTYDASTRTLVRVDGCIHQFCAGCVASWIAYKNTCPMCRNPRYPQNVSAEVLIASDVQIARTGYGLFCSSKTPFTTLQLMLLEVFGDAYRQAHGVPAADLDMAVNDGEELQGLDVRHNESDEDYEGSECHEDEGGFYSDDEAWDAAVGDEDVSFFFISMWVELLRYGR
jgi:hypothetical protein